MTCGRGRSLFFREDLGAREVVRLRCLAWEDAWGVMGALGR